MIQDSTFNICDGVNVKRLIKWTSHKSVDLFPGPDLFKLIFIDKSLGELRHLLIGGSPLVSRSLEQTYGSNNTKFIVPPFKPSFKDFDYESIANEINNFKPDIIWVGLGAPKQEGFIHTLYNEVDLGLLIGVGAAFNFYSGLEEFKRAPKVFQDLSLEWLFRLFQEPQRIGQRQLNSLFGLIRGWRKYRI